MNILGENTFQATEANLPSILAWAEERAEALDDFNIAMKLQLALEEAVVNVVNYAYDEADSVADRPLTITIIEEDSAVTVLLKDCGAPFNPLENITADAGKSLEEREEGGWGRALIKKVSCPVEYTYENGQNVLKMCFQKADE